MENIGAVSMGRQLFCMSTVGPPNKNPYLLSSLIMINIIANSKLSVVNPYSSNFQNFIVII